MFFHSCGVLLLCQLQYDYPPQYYPIEATGDEIQMENDLPQESEDIRNLEALQVRDVQNFLCQSMPQSGDTSSAGVVTRIICNRQ